MNSYLGFMWWDEETDGELMYPEHEKHPTAEEFVIRCQMNNPDEIGRPRHLVGPGTSWRT